VKVLYLMKRDADETARTLIDAQSERHEVSVIDLRREKDYHVILDAIHESDTIISW
jgi:hypothetical protein